MANARRVTEAEALGETEPVRNKYEPRPFIDIRIPADQFDRIRHEAYYETAYTSSHEEDQTLRAVDDAIFARIRQTEQLNLEKAAALLDNEGQARTPVAETSLGPRSRPNAFARADAHLAELAAIKRELRDGKTPVGDLADRFEKVRMAMRRDGNSLVVLSDKATKLRATLADPAAHAAKLLTYMNRDGWRPLGVRGW